MIELDIRILNKEKPDISKIVEQDLKSAVQFGPISVPQVIKGLMDAGNQKELIAMIGGEFLSGYKRGLMQCYDLLKEYDKQQVYDAIDSFDIDEFHKKILKSY